MSKFRTLPIAVRSVLFSVLISSLLISNASASVLIQNYMAARTTNSYEGLQVYEYGSGTDKLADFSSGTFSGTIENSGALELDGILGDWWDTDWESRHCVTVTSSDLVAEYPIRLEVNTSGTSSTGDDIRVIDSSGTQLTSYSEGPFPDTASVVYAKVAPLPAGDSDYCVYFENSGAPSVSDEIGTFEKSPGNFVNYYTMLNTYNNSPLQVISYSDDNTVTDGTTTVVLDTGDLHTFNGVDRDTIISATGPIEGSANLNGTETILPESYASNEFIFGVERGTNGTWIRSPFGNTTVEAIVNGVVVASTAITPADESIFLQANFTSDDTVTLRSTNGLDFLAIHKSTASNDVSIAVPWYAETLYGVRSRWILTGALSATTIDLEGSDGTSLSGISVSNLARHSINDATDGRGNGSAFSVTSAGPQISSYQYADENGGETTAFLPLSLLSETYLLPVNSNYFTIACPTNPTTVTFGGTSYNCGSTNANAPGFLYSGLGFHAAGTLIEADNPIFVYYENDSHNDEHNLLGAKGATPYLDEISYAFDNVQDLTGFCGTWVSPVLSSTGTFGTFSQTTTLPSGTSATFQISTDGSTFYGPDGTGASSFSDGDIVPYVADFASTLQIRIELCTNNASIGPSVASASVECDLAELTPDVSIVETVSIASDTQATVTPLVRVYQDRPGAWSANAVYISGTNLAALNADIDTDTPTTQISVAGGTITSPSPTFTHSTATPYTLTTKHATVSGQTSTVRLALNDVQQVQTSFELIVEYNG